MIASITNGATSNSIRFAALSSRMIERIFSGCVTRGRSKQNIQNGQTPRMSYTDFVWFLLAEEDKNHPTAIEYWFRCMDIDGDGILSMYELEYFYEEQQHRMEQLGIETLPFEDCLCQVRRFVLGWLFPLERASSLINLQMLDMIKPVKRDCITLTDLKRCKMTAIFFDTFFNLEKYMEHEQRDPFAQKEGEEVSYRGNILEVFQQISPLNFFQNSCRIGIVTPPRSMNCSWQKKATTELGNYNSICHILLDFSTISSHLRPRERLPFSAISISLYFLFWKKFLPFSAAHTVSADGFIPRSPFVSLRKKSSKI